MGVRPRTLQENLLQQGPEPCLPLEDSELPRRDPKVTPGVTRFGVLSKDESRRSSSSRKSLGSSCISPQRRRPSSSEEAQVGCLWPPAAAPAGASTAGREGLRPCASKGGLHLGRLLPERALFCHEGTRQAAQQLYRLFLSNVGNQPEQPWLLLSSHSSCLAKFPSLYPHRTTCPGLLPSDISQETSAYLPGLYP